MSEKIFTDTTDFFSIDYGDMIQIDGGQYLVKGHEREERFGIDDPKFWVKKVINLETEEKKILKLSFFESFETDVGSIKIRCFRNPDKEGAILDLVRDHPHFMSGIACKDTRDNNIRIIDIVKGINFFNYIDTFEMSYEDYFKDILPGILEKLVKAFKAIDFLHQHGQRHGDIRTDHLIVERDTGNYVWIDFDYDYDSGENPFSLDLFELGNVLLYAVGKGFHSASTLEKNNALYGEIQEHFEPGDFSIIHKWKLVNLKKIFPIIPVDLNDILMHFSSKADIFYESAGELIEDINVVRHSIF